MGFAGEVHIVRVGQRYRDVDPRAEGREGEVIWVQSERACLRWTTGRKTWVSFKRLANPRQYQLVEVA